MITDKQSWVLNKAEDILRQDKGSIPKLGDLVAEYCEKQGICTRCHCRWAEPLRKNCSRCLAYKRINKIHAKDKADTGTKKANKSIRSR